MADVRIWKVHLESKSLPQVCVKTGEPASKWVKVQYVHRPSWLWWTIIAGVLIFAILDYAISKRVAAQLPVSRQVWQRRLLQGLAGTALIIGGIVAFFVALVDSNGALVAVALGVALAGLVLVVIRSNAMVKGKVDEHGESVELLGVHRRFADALASAAPPGATTQFAPTWVGGPTAPVADERPWEPTGGWGGGSAS